MEEDDVTSLVMLRMMEEFVTHELSPSEVTEKFKNDKWGKFMYDYEQNERRNQRYMKHVKPFHGMYGKSRSNSKDFKDLRKEAGMNTEGVQTPEKKDAARPPLCPDHKVYMLPVDGDNDTRACPEPGCTRSAVRNKSGRKTPSLGPGTEYAGKVSLAIDPDKNRVYLVLAEAGVIVDVTPYVDKNSGVRVDQAEGSQPAVNIGLVIDGVPSKLNGNQTRPS